MLPKQKRLLGIDKSSWLDGNEKLDFFQTDGPEATNDLSCFRETSLFCG